MSIFNLYSVEEIDSLISKVMTSDRTAHTNHPISQDNDRSGLQVDEEFIIDDILAMGMEILKGQEDGAEIEGLQSRQENSFTIKESFEQIPKIDSNKQRKVDSKLLDSVQKHKTMHHKFLENCASKRLEQLIKEQGSIIKTTSKGINLGNKLHQQQSIRQERIMNAQTKQKIMEKYRVTQQSQRTTLPLRVPFKKALQRRGQQLTIGHRLHENAQSLRLKKQKSILQKLEKDKQELKGLTFKPQLNNSKSYKMANFYERLEKSKEKSLIKRAQILIDELKSTPFHQKLLNPRGSSKISSIWKPKQLHQTSKSHNILSKSFFSQHSKSFMKAGEKSSFIEIKNPEELNFLLE